MGWAYPVGLVRATFLYVCKSDVQGWALKPAGSTTNPRSIAALLSTLAQWLLLEGAVIPCSVSASPILGFLSSPLSVQGVSSGRYFRVDGFCRSVQMLNDVIADVVEEEGGEVSHWLTCVCSRAEGGGGGRVPELSCCQLVQLQCWGAGCCPLPT